MADELRILRNFSNMDDAHCAMIDGYLKATDDRDVMEVPILAGWGLMTKTNYDYLKENYPNIFLFDYPVYIYGGSARVIVPNLDNEVCDGLLNEFKKLSGYPLLDEDAYSDQVNELKINEANELHRRYPDIPFDDIYETLYGDSAEYCFSLDYNEEEIIATARKYMSA